MFNAFDIQWIWRRAFSVSDMCCAVCGAHYNIKRNLLGFIIETGINRCGGISVAICCFGGPLCTSIAHTHTCTSCFECSAFALDIGDCALHSISYHRRRHYNIRTSLFESILTSNRTHEVLKMMAKRVKMEKREKSSDGEREKEQESVLFILCMKYT